MEIIAMELSAVLLLAAIIVMHRRQRRAAQDQHVEQLIHLDELASSAALTKQTCLSALDNLHKNLAALEQRTAFVERKLGGLMEAPAMARKDHYEAAALLLAAGHTTNRVAAMLDLPVAQIEMIRELKTILASEPKAPGASVAPPAAAKAAKRKTESRPAKARIRPIMLTEVVEPAQALNG